MITAPLLSQGVNVDLPKASAKPLTQQKTPIILSINAAGQFFLNIARNPDQPLDESALKNQVAQKLETAKTQEAGVNVFVKGDRHVDYDRVMKAMVLLQEAGAESVGLITEDPT
jgi:biopolymer transport protein TolR